MKTFENNNNTVSLLKKSVLEQNSNHGDTNYLPSKHNDTNDLPSDHGDANFSLVSSSPSPSHHFNVSLKDINGHKSSDLHEILDNDDKNISKKNVEGESDNSWNEGEQNFGSSTFYVSSPFAVRLSNRKRVSNDEAYYLAKELLMTERTFRKDLEIVNVVFREEFYKQTKIHSEAIEHILSVIDPLYEIHCSLLRDLEQRIAYWEGRHVNKTQQTIKGVADVLLQHKEMVKIHSTYLDRLSLLLEILYKDLNENQNLSQMYQHFESQKSCYLPLTSFFLRPTFRLLYYSSILQGLLNVYNTAHVDYYNCMDMIENLKIYCDNFENIIKPLVNYTKLMELQRSLHGFPSLVNKTREFIREGCLLKFTKSGSHQHMFFLFSDILLYTSRVHDGQLHFKVQGHLSTEDLKMQDTEPKLGVKHCFLLCTSEKHLFLASPSNIEHAKWMEDLEKVKSTNRMSSRQSSLASLKSDSFEEDIVISSEDKPASHHINTSIHICWHRNISISCKDIFFSMKTCMSGYLLRKFKNSSNWQKVWVVLANFCLFFYRSYLDECPLASLPLVGYRILNTSNSDLVSGENIFKLVYKNHEYFFMVENKYSYKRWMEAIHICTLIEEENTQL